VTPEERIQRALRDYEQIEVLAPLRAQSPLVPGCGPLDSPLMLIGEAPGEQEVRQLKPFVGPAGHFLDKMLIGAGILPQLCYVTNVVLYRPPGNRTPEQFEIHASRRRLMTEIYVVGPPMIITLGAVALRALRPKAGPVSEIHGQLDIIELVYPGEDGSAAAHQHFCTLLPTFHPAAALRDRIVHEKMLADLSSLTRMMEAARDRGTGLRGP